MGEAVSGLLRRPGKCAGNSRRIRHIRAELIFRGPQQKCAHNPNEISSLWAELVFRQIPGKLVQRHRHPQRLRRLLLRRALLDPVGRGVFPIPPPPTRLCLPSPRALAFRLAAGMLPLSYSRVRPKPTAACWAMSISRCASSRLHSKCSTVTRSIFASPSLCRSAVPAGNGLQRRFC